MIVDQNSHPQRQLYYLGARTLEILNDVSAPIGFFDVYQKLKEGEDVSVKLFTLTLDWLYLLGAITSEGGGIKKCS